jgi:hypothetical protein
MQSGQGRPALARSSLREREREGWGARQPGKGGWATGKGGGLGQCSLVETGREGEEEGERGGDAI